MSKKKKNKAAIKVEVAEKPLPPKPGKQLLTYIENASPIQFSIIAFIIIIIAGYLSYSNSLNGEMIFDDINIIQQNDRLHNFDDFQKLDKWLNPNTRHFCMLTFAVNYSIDGYNVFGYHLVNMIIHFLYAFFIFLLSRLILSISIFDNNPQRKYSGLIALFIALVCVIHPIQTQSVSYIVQRMTSMASMFYIMTVFFYGKGRLLQVRDRLNGKVVMYYAFALISIFLGAFSKQIIITVPIILLLFELFFIRNKDGVIFKKYLIISSSLILVVLLTVVFGGFLPTETDMYSRSDYLFTQSRVIVKYIQLLIVPANQALDYDFTVSYGFGDWKVIMSSIIILAIIAAGFFLYNKKHLVSFGIFWFFITLSLESSIIPIQDVINEHRLYLSMFGFSLLFVSIVWDMFASKHLYGVIIFFLVLSLIYGLLTHHQNNAWKSKLSLWLDNTNNKPHNSRAFNNLGSTYITLGNYVKAEEAYTEATRLKPDYVDAMFNLGNVKIDLGKPNESIEVFNQLLEADSTYHPAYYSRGMVYANLQQYKRAISDYDKAYTKREIQHNIAVYNKSGIAKMSLNDYEAAISDFNQALKLNPDFEEAYNNRGLVYLSMGEYDKAIVEFSKAIELKPAFFEAYNNRGNAYFKLKLSDKALSDYQTALNINPQSVSIIKNIALIHYNNKNYGKTIELYTQILSFDPQNASVLNDRGITYYVTKEYEKSFADLTQARQLGMITNPSVFEFLQQYMSSKTQK